ncbi:Zn-dependent hydrolase [Paenibacillus sp. AK121]|uniref:MBL fold metallo-hydrolase n=1 Tax=Paenibacillus sp. AK121 TaxID=2849670 RepID=UPI001C21913D|nr:MBL fold metallo-hydrolase [Paenibacillus sp. AK121]MBU9705492.1 Zn-dependent hydrolase [Paenibacillus sp. AK121]
MLEVKMFPASYGDSFLISCRGKAINHILVDMGFATTYEKFISEELQKIKAEGISLLIFTHVDEDHILGGVRFFKKNGHSDNPNSIDIREIWYNSFRHLQFNKIQTKGELSINSGMKNILSIGYPREIGVREVADIGYKQGSTLGSLILQNGYENKWNTSFNHKAVVVDENEIKVNYTNEELSITLLSPNIENLQLLSNKWAEKLSSLGYQDKVNSDQTLDDAFEFYMSNIQMEQKQRKVQDINSTRYTLEEIAQQSFEPDRAEVNGSSIAFILEFNSKKLLFLGDCHSEIIENNLKKLLNQRKEEKMWFDMVKVSHHGSKHNTSVSMLELIHSNKYIFSTNGKGKNFSHPDIETIYRIISTDNTPDKELIFNYKPFRILNKFNVPNLMEKYSYSIHYTNDLANTLDDVPTIISFQKNEKVKEEV